MFARTTTLAAATAALCLTLERPAASAPPDPMPPLAPRPVIPTIETEADASKVRTIRWNERWGKVRAPELILTGVATGIAIAGQVIEPIGTSWRAPQLGDDDVRGVLRLSTEGERRVARDYSDVLLTTLTGFPVIFDALIVAGWSRQSPDVAAQMVLIDAEVFAVTMAIQGVTNVLVNRERPYADRCGGELPEDSLDCEGSTRHRSFFSGHTAIAFAAAALTCTHQANLDLYENPQMGGAICTSAILLAATTGTLRIAGDVHNLTDVLVGAGVGTLVGFGLPWLFHYRHGDVDDPPEGESDGPRVHLAPMGLGLTAFGSF